MGTIKRGFANNILTTGKFDATDLSGTIPSSNVANTTLSSVTSVPASIGDLVQTTATDPSPVTAGDVWYNTTSRTLKAGVLQAAAWASGGNMNTAREQVPGVGTQSAALGFGGTTATDFTAATESYNGTSWTSVNSLNSPRRGAAGAGTQTAAVAGSGYAGGPVNTTATELWNGTSWTSNPTGLGTAVSSNYGVGSQSNGLVIGGYNPSAISGENSGKFGIEVEDTLGYHLHDLYDPGHRHNYSWTKVEGGGSSICCGSKNAPQPIAVIGTSSVSLGAIKVKPEGGETRPKNMGLIYCIKT
jgi:hypothetical protein